jgi:hypothetical protein
MQNGSAQILSTLYKYLNPLTNNTLSFFYWYIQIFRSVEDIDLFIAGNHEIPLADAIVGPTFACIIVSPSNFCFLLLECIKN